MAQNQIPPPPPGFQPVDSTPPPPPGFQPFEIPDNSVTQTGPKTFQGPNVQMPYSMKSLGQGLTDLGKGVAEGPVNDASNIVGMLPGQYAAKISGNLGRLAQPANNLQGLGRGLEQGAEFFAPATLESRLAGAATKVAPFLGETLPKIGMQALSSGAMNRLQGGTFGGGALGGAIAGGIGSAAKAIAPTVAESALGVRNVDRSFAKTPGQAIINETRGVRPSTVAASAEERIGSLTDRLEQAAANSGTVGSTKPAIGVVDDAIAKKAGQNSPVVDDLGTLRNQLTVNRTNGLPLASNQSATGILNLKRGVNDTIGRWPIEQQKGIKGVARQVYGSLDNELDRVVPGSDQINQRISSLIPVANRANAADLNANLLQRSLGRLGRHTGALTMAGLGAAEGKQEGGTPGAIAGGLTGLFAPEVLASPTTLMVGARSLNALGGPMARYSAGLAQQLFRTQKANQSQ